jgi:hypothetical protein
MKIFEKLGMTPGRFRVEWISAAEGDKYARIINEMQKVINSIPREQLLKEIETLRPQMEQRSRRMYDTPQISEAVTYSDKLNAILTHKEGQDGGA